MELSPAAQWMLVAVATAIGPLAARWLYDRLGNYQLALWLTALTFLLAALSVALTPAAGAALARTAGPAAE